MNTNSIKGLCGILIIVGVPMFAIGSALGPTQDLGVIVKSVGMSMVGIGFTILFWAGIFALLDIRDATQKTAEDIAALRLESGRKVAQEKMRNQPIMAASTPDQYCPVALECPSCTCTIAVGNKPGNYRCPKCKATFQTDPA